MTVRRLTLIALAAAAVLAGCGRQGELERPRPLFGKPSTPAADAKSRDQAMARARADGAKHADPRAPQSIDEVREQGVASLRILSESDAPAESSAPPQ